MVRSSLCTFLVLFLLVNTNLFASDASRAFAGLALTAIQDNQATGNQAPRPYNWGAREPRSPGVYRTSTSRPTVLGGVR